MFLTTQACNRIVRNIIQECGIELIWDDLGDIDKRKTFNRIKYYTELINIKQVLKLESNCKEVFGDQLIRIKYSNSNKGPNKGLNNICFYFKLD